eukprot:CAMPEP_0170775512 /NCGR_PEP_ID=MMETSP0733-20121128/10628_1 /TAXON_ID=186038 /ORGANISM="Fragilariopsis kerguelensis, Strain L26-C5" /LENGTH=264 /DNA_ID=CAMNT_0011118335 /DNA_START=76 /DNA_END=870 /DNA_ORIENTATION=+
MELVDTATIDLEFKKEWAAIGYYLSTIRLLSSTTTSSSSSSSSSAAVGAAVIATAAAAAETTTITKMNRAGKDMGHEEEEGLPHRSAAIDTRQQEMISYCNYNEMYASSSSTAAAVVAGAKRRLHKDHTNRGSSRTNPTNNYIIIIIILNNKITNNVSVGTDRKIVGRRIRCISGSRYYSTKCDSECNSDWQREDNNIIDNDRQSKGDDDDEKMNLEDDVVVVVLVKQADDMNVNGGTHHHKVKDRRTRKYKDKNKTNDGIVVA